MTNQSETETGRERSSFAAMLFGHTILFLFCVGLPTIFTAAAPLTTIHLGRSGETVRAQITKHLLFVIPFQHRQIANVEAIDNSTVAGVRNPSRLTPGQSSSATQTESSGVLTIVGANTSAKIEVSPASIASVRARIDRFLSDPRETQLRVLAVANWKFGVVLGGLLSLLTLFYLYLQTASLLRWLRNLKT